MTLWHRIYLTVDEHGWAYLAGLGLSLDPEAGPGKYFHLDLEDKDSRWPTVKRLALSYSGASIFTYTGFTLSDIGSADFLELSAREVTMPPPKRYGPGEDPWDDTDGCFKCGIGFKLLRPMRLQKPIRWGKRSIVMLSGMWDVAFVRRDAWESVFEPMGIISKPVLLHATGEQLQDTLQLDATLETRLDLHPSEPYEDCEACGRRRYDLHNIGFMPGPLKDPGVPMFRSIEWFGTGPGARQQLMVSKQVRSRIEEAGLVGAVYRPCGPQMPQWKQPLESNRD